MADFALFEREVARGEAPWLRALRREAIERFTQVGFPTARRGNEPWKYTDVGPIARTPFRYPFEAASVPLPASTLRRLILSRRWARLVFVNGRYRPDLSSTEGLPSGFCAGNLVATDPEAASRHLAKWARLDGDGFTALNTAFIQDVACVCPPAGTALDVPIHLLFISTGAERETGSYPRVLIVAGRGSATTVVESYVGLAGPRSFTDAVTEVVLEEGAVLRHYRLVQEGADAYHVGTTQVHQGPGAVFHDMSIAAGGLLVRNTLNVLLDGEGSACHLNGLYLLSGMQHVDNSTFIDHAGPRTTSRELYKGILDGKSRAVFGGRILVRKGAQKADAHQTNKSLVLSDGAEVDTKPHLEILADDVKCSHGAAVGKLEHDKLFYLRSRGLDEQRARELLAHAFAAEVLDRITLRPVKAQVERRLLKSLPSLRSEG